MAEISAGLVKELRERDRRRDDGLQARARGDRAATSRRPQATCARRASRRRRSAPGRETTEGKVAIELGDDARGDGRRRLRDRAGLEQRGVPHLRRSASSTRSRSTARRRPTSSRTSASSCRRSSARTSSCATPSASRPRRARSSPATSTRRRTRSACSSTAAATRTSPGTLAMHISFAAPLYLTRGRGARGGGRRRARDPLQAARRRGRSRTRSRRRSSRAGSRSGSSEQRPRRAGVDPRRQQEGRPGAEGGGLRGDRVPPLRPGRVGPWRAREPRCRRRRRSAASC